MLKIWFRGSKGIEVLADSDSYFDNVWEDEWMLDPFVQQMILDIDKSKVIGPHLIESPVLGPIGPKDLSGGTKTLILMLKDDSFIYNLSNCGDNCAKWVLEIGKQKDLIVFLGYMMRFEGNFDIEILNTNKIVHNRQELIKEMIIADGMLNSGIYERPEFI